MTILVATDFSEFSRAAADVAAFIARRRGEDLDLVHVVDGPLLPSMANEHNVHDEARRIAHVHSCRARGLLLNDGNTGQRIADEAEREGATLVVVGAAGEGARTGIGSVAGSVLRHTKAPVFVVRDAQRLFAAMDRGNGTLRALIALALDDTNAPVLDTLELAACAGDFIADVVHCQALPEELRDRRTSKLIGEREVREELEKRPVGMRLDAVFVHNASGGPPQLAREVAALAQTRHADFIVCGSHHQRRSTAEEILRNASLSVLVAGAPASTTMAMRDDKGERERNASARAHSLV